jgi:hypothetical protein
MICVRFSTYIPKKRLNLTENKEKGINPLQSSENPWLSNWYHCILFWTKKLKPQSN